MRKVLPGFVFLLLPGLGMAQLDQAVPAPLRTARKVFVGGSGTAQGVASTLAFNSMFEQLQRRKVLSATTDPSQADLLLEVGVDTPVSDVTGGSSFRYPVLRVLVRDRKTYALLWSFVQNVAKSKTFDSPCGAVLDALEAWAKAPAMSQEQHP